jgi:hypothetical protein
MSPKILHISTFFFDQIWVIPLVDDRQYSNLYHKIRKKKNLVPIVVYIFCLLLLVVSIFIILLHVDWQHTFGLFFH